MKKLSSNNKEVRCRRQSNLELLRIISILLIIGHHYALYSGFHLVEQDISFNKFFVEALYFGGKFGASLFVLIIGYFLVNSSVTLKKAVKLWIKVTIVSVLCLIIFWLLGTSMGLKIIIKNVFPIIYSAYWFMTAYFVLYLLSGYINKFIHALSRKEYFRLLVFLSIILSFIPTFMKAYMISSVFVWFVFLYLIAGYIRLYNPILLNSKWCLLIGVLVYLLTISSSFAFEVLGVHYTFFKTHALYFATIEKFPLLIAAVFLFAGFKNLKIKNSKIINTLASCSFGVYLIHDNMFVSDYIWTCLFKNILYFDKWYLFLEALGVIIIIYVVCVILDLFYQFVIERFLERLIDSRGYEIEKKFGAFLEKIGM